MNMPAPKFGPRKITVEERLARLEVDVKYLQSDISEMKSDIRRLVDKVDAKFGALNQKIDAVKDCVRDGVRWPKPQ